MTVKVLCQIGHQQRLMLILQLGKLRSVFEILGYTIIGWAKSDWCYLWEFYQTKFSMMPNFPSKIHFVYYLVKSIHLSNELSQGSDGAFTKIV